MSNYIFDEIFGDAAELTNLINRSVFNPGVIARLGLFEESGISSTRAAIDMVDESLHLLPLDTPRGGVGAPYTRGGSETVTIEARHIKMVSGILADAVQNKRRPGTTDLMDVQELRDSTLRGMRKDIELTIEFARLGAIRGQIVNYDGTVLDDLFAAFGLEQQTVAMDLSNSSTMLLNRVIDAERLSEDKLGGETPTGYVGLAAPDFMDSLRMNPSYQADLRHAAPSELLKDFRTGISIGGTTFIELRGTPGLPARIPEGEAYLLPLGIQGLFMTKYAPADYVETVNNSGLPIYVKSEPMKFGRGYEIESQSNPISICTRPASVIRLLKGAE